MVIAMHNTPTDALSWLSAVSQFGTKEKSAHAKELNRYIESLQSALRAWKDAWHAQNGNTVPLQGHSFFKAYNQGNAVLAYPAQTVEEV